MILKNLDIITLSKSLNGLDTFKFNTSTFLALAKNLRLVTGPFADIQKAEQELRKTPDTMQEEWRNLLEAKSEDIPFLTVTTEDLQIEKNEISVSTLAGLYPIISNLP